MEINETVKNLLQQIYKAWRCHKMDMRSCKAT